MPHVIDTTHFKALLFDFDGTLVDTEPIQYEAFVQTLGQYEATYVSFAQHGTRYAGRGSRYIFTQEIERHNLKIDIEELLAKRNARYLSLVKAKGVQKMAGLDTLLERVKKLGLKLAIVSGGHKDNIFSVMGHADIPNVFDAIVSIEDVSTPKPDPQGFIIALKSCHILADQAVSFEDGLSGIAAAKAAKIGKRFAISRQLDKMQVQKADQEAILIQDFKELRLR